MSNPQVSKEDLLKLYTAVVRRKNKLHKVLFDRYSLVITESPKENDILRIEYIICDILESKACMNKMNATKQVTRVRTCKTMCEMVSYLVTDKRRCIKKLNDDTISEVERKELSIRIDIIDKYLKIVKLEKLL